MVPENNQDAMFEREEPAGQVAPATDGRLTVKIKLPKAMEDEALSPLPPPPPPPPQPEQVRPHFCPDCNKTFSSGKAYGGHMSSAHVQANRDLSAKKLKSKTAKQQHKSGSGLSSGPETEILCSLCGKDFPSRKSLFGHMRCHPEREWRGMEPPQEPKMACDDDDSPSEPEEGDKDDDDDDDDGLFRGGELQNKMGSGQGPARDLSVCVPGWPVTAKRGRTGASSAVEAPRVPLGLERKDLAAVHNLIRLVNGEEDEIEFEEEDDDDVDDMSGSSGTQQGPESENRSSGSLMKKPRIMDTPVSFAKKKQKVWNDDDGDDVSDDPRVCDKGKNVLVSAEETPDYSSDDDYGFEERDVGPMRTDRRRKGKAVAGPSGVQEKEDWSPDKYICATCKKRFPTHQALGGHRSSHNKFKLSVYNTIDEQKNMNTAGRKEDKEEVDVEKNKNNSKIVKGARVKGKGKKIDDDHVEETGMDCAEDGMSNLCKISNKSFENVEALESHKKSHCNGLLDEASSGHGTTSHTDETPARGLDFDLNEMPNESEEDGVQSKEDGDGGLDPSFD